MRDLIRYSRRDHSATHLLLGVKVPEHLQWLAVGLPVTASMLQRVKLARRVAQLTLAFISSSCSSSGLAPRMSDLSTTMSETSMPMSVDLSTPSNPGAGD